MTTLNQHTLESHVMTGEDERGVKELERGGLASCCMCQRGGWVGMGGGRVCGVVRRVEGGSVVEGVYIGKESIRVGIYLGSIQ